MLSIVQYFHAVTNPLNLLRNLANHLVHSSDLLLNQQNQGSEYGSEPRFIFYLIYFTIQEHRDGPSVLPGTWYFTQQACGWPRGYDGMRETVGQQRDGQTCQYVCFRILKLSVRLRLIFFCSCPARYDQQLVRNIRHDLNLVILTLFLSPSTASFLNLQVDVLASRVCTPPTH
jgi:hypothetical protein